MKALKIIVIYFALTISVLLVFWQLQNYDFISFDDQEYVYENRHVLDGLTQDGVLWAFTGGYAANWHPMTWLSFMLDCQLFGQNPGRMHMVNVLLHLANTLLLFAVLKKMTGSLWPSAFVAAAFALHPMHVESVAWITERKDVLSTLFWLLTMAAYAGYVKRPSVFRYATALLLFALGLMAKPMLVTLPFVLLLLDYWPLNRFGSPGLIKKSSRSTPVKDKRLILYHLILEKIPFVALSAVSSTITFLVQRGAMTPMHALGYKDRIFNAVMAYCEYIKKMFWPKDLAVFYPLDTFDGTPVWQFLLCVLLLAGVTILVLFWGRSRKYLPVGWFWFIGTIVPVIGLVQVGSHAYADRYTYIPHIGLLVMIAWGLPELLSGWPYRRAVLGVLMVSVLMASGVCAHRQTNYWKDTVTLFSQALKSTENNYIMYNNLGFTYLSLGRYEEAIEAHQQAIQIKPDFADAHINLGVALDNVGHHEEAIEAYQQAIQIKPNDYNLGLAYIGLGRYQEAIEAYNQAIKIKPQDAKSHNNLGIAYGGLGHYEEAVKAYQQAIRIQPQYANAYNNLGEAYCALGRHEEAIEAFKQAIRIRPNDAKPHNNLGLAYYSLGRYQEALEAFGQTIRIRSDYPDAYNNLGEAYFTLGRHEEAIAAYRQAIKINPDDAKSYNNLGLAYSSLGRYQEAVEAFGQTTRIWPENADAHINLGRAYHILDRYQEAITAYQQAINIKPERADAHLSLGLAYVKIRDTASATKEYEILKTLNAEMADKLFKKINK